MRTLGKIAATFGVFGAMAAGSAMPASAIDVHIGPHGVYIGHRHHDYYNYYGGDDYNPCRPGWTVQGGVCKPFRGLCPPGWTIQHGVCKP
jgi:hypothetical protein